MFYIVGIGLGGVKDITVRGLEIVKSADKIFLESYTSILLSADLHQLEEFYGKKITVADRELVEVGTNEILNDAKNSNVVLLVVGDPFSATTHTDLVLRAKNDCIPVEVVHNASIMNAVGCCGLQLYNFGETISIPFWTETWKPESFFNKICSNKERGLHTLCLLDIKVKEPTPESLTKKKVEYMPPQFMSVSTAASQLMQIAEQKNSSECQVNGETLCVGLARVGSDNQEIVVTSLDKMRLVDLGPPLHSLVIVGFLHPLEEEFLKLFQPKLNV